MDDPRREIEQLKLAVEHRTIIGIALGMLMERLDISRDDAFAYLQGISSRRETKLYDVARNIVETRELPDRPMS